MVLDYRQKWRDEGLTRDQAAQALLEKAVPSQSGPWRPPMQLPDSQARSPSEDPSDGYNPLQPATAWASQNLNRAAQVRLDQYNPRVRALDPFDDVGRALAKVDDRYATPAPERGLIYAVRGEDRGPRAGSVGSANKTNPRWTAAAKAARLAGAVSGLASAGLDAYEIATAKDKARAAARVAGSNAIGIPAGIAGAEVGGALGSIFPGLGTAIGAGLGGFAGSALGGKFGNDATGDLYDWLKRHFGQQR